jgi:hypothetical protein
MLIDLEECILLPMSVKRSRPVVAFQHLIVSFFEPVNTSRSLRENETKREKVWTSFLQHVASKRKSAFGAGRFSHGILKTLHTERSENLPMDWS